MSLRARTSVLDEWVGALPGTKKKTTTVRDVVDGGDIPDLQLQITLWRTQMTRSAPAKPSGNIGEGQ